MLKQRDKSADSYISPDDDLPDKRISIFERSQGQIDASQIERTYMDQSNTDPLGQNSLYQIEHDNSQLHVLNRPLLNQFRAGSMNTISNPISRMGLAADQNNALNQTGLSALSLSNLNITWHLSNQGAANVAANRQLLAKAAQGSLGI